MAEYIEREAAIGVIMGEPTEAHYPSWYADKVKNIQAADVAPVVHGCTVPAEQPKNVLLDRKCGICESLMLSTDVYCPNCGAKMDSEV